MSKPGPASWEVPLVATLSKLGVYDAGDTVERWKKIRAERIAAERTVREVKKRLLAKESERARRCGGQASLSRFRNGVPPGGPVEAGGLAGQIGRNGGADAAGAGPGRTRDNSLSAEGPPRDAGGHRRARGYPCAVSGLCGSYRGRVGRTGVDDRQVRWIGREKSCCLLRGQTFP